MNSYVPNTNQNLKVIRRAADGSVTLVPIIYWIDLRTQRVPVDLSRMTDEFWILAHADFAVHDASDGRVYLRDGNIYDTLETFAEASR